MLDTKFRDNLPWITLNLRPPFWGNTKPLSHILTPKKFYSSLTYYRGNKKNVVVWKKIYLSYEKRKNQFLNGKLKLVKLFNGKIDILLIKLTKSY